MIFFQIVGAAPTNQNPIRFVGDHHDTIVRVQVYAKEFHHGLLTAKDNVRTLNFAPTRE